jgi:hypothetical protein
MEFLSHLLAAIIQLDLPYPSAIEAEHDDKSS